MSKGKGRRPFGHPMQNKPPQSPAITMQKALALHRQGQLAQAEPLYREILKKIPGHGDALHMLGVIENRRRNYDAAVQLIGQALKSNPKSAIAHSNIGNALSGLNRHDEALASYDRALAIQPDFVDALNNRGNTLNRLKRHEEALASYDRALVLRPDDAEALNSRGNALNDLKRHEEALASCDRALAIKPDFAEALNNRGNALNKLKRHVEALASYDRALAMRPDFAEALNNRGNALNGLKRHEEALASCDHALALRPDYAGALDNRGNALLLLQRYEEAAADLERLLRLDSDHEYARGRLLRSRMHCCDWNSFDVEAARAATDVRSGRRSTVPFDLLAVSQAAADQLLCSQIWVRDDCPPSASPVWQGERYRHDRIRIAYLSADFHDHATAYLMAGLFELHDRERFETIALSFGPDSAGEMRTRLEAAFDRFIDIRPKSDREVAAMMRALEVDIAVDLKGFTADARTGIFALRAAPIQVNYLGYPGTMGADYIDYILADRWVIPEADQQHYAEKIVYLPDTYQVNDRKRRIGERTPARAALGLPETGFVFCSFNNNYKITPFMFDIWMRLLHQVEGSVLWLLEGNAAVVRNLRREAEKRRVAPDRLVFAPRMKLEDHLARHRRADLFLDTLPCTAHTTASDALWAGLPLVTCLGSTFAGRVAASLLDAVGLPELIARSLEDYEALALALANDRTRLASLKSRLAQNRETFPLFDTDRFRRHIESAYATMWQRHQRGEPPAGFAVAPEPRP